MARPDKAYFADCCSRDFADIGLPGQTQAVLSQIGVTGRLQAPSLFSIEMVSFQKGFGSETKQCLPASWGWGVGGFFTFSTGGCLSSTLICLSSRFVGCMYIRLYITRQKFWLCCQSHERAEQRSPRLSSKMHFLFQQLQCLIVPLYYNTSIFEPLWRCFGRNNDLEYTHFGKYSFPTVWHGFCLRGLNTRTGSKSKPEFIHVRPTLVN